MRSLCRAALLIFLGASAWAQTQAPSLRLGHDVEPKRMSVDLTLVPSRDDFSGDVQIQLRVNQAVRIVWLNATDLNVTTAVIEQDGAPLQTKVIPGGEDFVGFETPSALHTGDALLKLSYKGKVNRRSSAGIFRSDYDQDSYLFTQFEPIDARRALPCFDEPGFKIPWQITLHVPQGASAVGNTNIAEETRETNGMKAVRFRETKPLPSYLVAFGVGPFEFVSAGTTGSRRIPVRIVVPKGDTARAKYAADVTAGILDRLEKYFGIPYPYDKADQLAIPLSFGGAMENPGLVTYDSNIVLSPPGQDSPTRQRAYAEVAAHELAHQWFGDMVTMAWWNDLWLNESFATWMSARLIADWKPEWNTRAHDQQARLVAIETDTKTNARRINQPAESKSDIANAFDGITYQKGGSVLATFENIAGSENFRHAVHDYLTAHMFGNARAEDFLDALARSSKPELSGAFSTFLKQAGVPELSTTMHCEKGKQPTLEVKQRRLLPAGSEGSIDRTWTIPVCVAYSFETGRHDACKLVDSRTAEITLPEGTGCPAWYLANAKEVGYYAARYDQPALERLFAHRNELTLAEQVGLLGDLRLLADLGAIPFDQTLALVPKLKDDPHEQIVAAAIGLATLRNQFVPPGMRTGYANFVEENFGERARSLGWKPKQGENEEVELLRAKLVPFVAIFGRDYALTREAKQLTHEWFTNRRVVSTDIAEHMLAAAASDGDAKLFDEVLEAAKAERDPFFRLLLVRTLGRFRDKALLERSFKLAFDGTFDLRESFRILLGPLGDPDLAELPYKYVKAHYDEIVPKLPTGIGTDYAALFPQFASSSACSESAWAEAKTFFTPRTNQVQGGPRELANALETIHLCASQRPVAEAQISNFLAHYEGSSGGAGAGGGRQR